MADDFTIELPEQVTELAAELRDRPINRPATETDKDGVPLYTRDKTISKEMAVLEVRGQYFTN